MSILFRTMILSLVILMSFAISLAQEKDRPLKILTSLNPERSNCGNGTLTGTLRITFDRSEKITHVDLVHSTGCASFDDNLLRAARTIKFLAEIRHGERVTVIKQIEYTYSIY